MTIKKFLEEEIESAKGSVEYCEMDLTKRKQRLFMLEQMLSHMEEK